MTTVVWNPALGGDGSTITDQDFDNGGHRIYFLPQFNNLLNVADFVLGIADDTITSNQNAIDVTTANAASALASANSATASAALSLQYRNESLTFSTNSATSASQAATSASNAASSAAAALASEGVATTKAAEASVSATTATTKAGEALASAISASTSATTASAAATQANNSAATASSAAVTATQQAVLATASVANGAKPYATYAAALADLGNIATGQIVDVVSDETRGGLRALYQDNGTTLVFIRTVEQYVSPFAYIPSDSLQGMITKLLVLVGAVPQLPPVISLNFATSTYVGE